MIRDGKLFWGSEHVVGADSRQWTDLPAESVSGFEAFWDKLAGGNVALVTVAEATRQTRVIAALL